MLVMAPPRVHVSPTHHALRVGTVKPSLHHCSIIHEALGQAHLLPLAPVPDPAVHQGVVSQDHHDHCDQDQGPTPDLMPAPGCVQTLVVLRGPFTLILHPLKLYHA